MQIVLPLKFEWRKAACSFHSAQFYSYFWESGNDNSVYRFNHCLSFPTLFFSHFFINRSACGLFRRYSTCHFITIAVTFISFFPAIRSLLVLLLVIIDGTESIFTAVTCSTVDNALLSRTAQHHKVPYNYGLPFDEPLCSHIPFFVSNYCERLTTSSRAWSDSLMLWGLSAKTSLASASTSQRHRNIKYKLVHGYFSCISPSSPFSFSTRLYR